jgi:hypothetical protein
MRSHSAPTAITPTSAEERDEFGRRVKNSTEINSR